MDNKDDLSDVLEYFKTNPDFLEIINGKYCFDLTHVCKQDDYQAENLER